MFEIANVSSGYASLQTSGIQQFILKKEM